MRGHSSEVHRMYISQSFGGLPHASQEQGTMSLAEVHYIGLQRHYGPLQTSDGDFKSGTTWGILVPLWTSLPCFSEVSEKGKLGLLPKCCESQRKQGDKHICSLNIE